MRRAPVPADWWPCRPVIPGPPISVQLIFEALPAWREAAIEGRPSLPRLERLDWRVDVVAGSSSAATAAGGTPVVLLDCLVRDTPARTDALPASRHVAVELDAASLGALLDGMNRIKDQLASAVQ